MEFLLKIEEFFDYVWAGVGMLGELLRPVSICVHFFLQGKLEAMSVTLL